MKPRTPLTVFAATLVLSLIAHALVISGHWITMPKTESEQLSLLARLEPAPAVAPKTTPPPPAKQTAPRPPAATRVAAAPPPSSSIPSIPSMSSMSPFSLPVEAPAEVSTTLGNTPESPAEAPAPEPVVIAEAAPSTLVIEAATLKTLPRRGHIAYALLLGTDRFNVGRTVQTWETTGSNYRMESVSETTGLAAAFRSDQLVFRSAGRMTPQGLQPESAQKRRTRRGQTEESTARFDWAGSSITIATGGAGASQRTGALPAGSQDILSVMYQLSLAPPPAGRIQLAIANGARFETIEFEVSALETLETPIGAVRALPVRQVRKAGMESFEFWLAAEYRHLPVRIRFLGRDGAPTGEQLVTEIRVSEE